ncbi:UNVERIFIED_CONTAM: hypothetical protein Sradi_4304800 [Sesamum radiatum]|uniref:Myb/SANT-like DNA-binding domain-containing protein n=1 Tax=Sesamum radiatum TaxID=300843 RepID=A0AAW2NMN0_SESRA
MTEKGFNVSPQQCEDKFNDLNKRYKRVNDILGKGTACGVVENPSLLDTMDHLSPKMKEEVRKLLNSKHLFFREMCAYHNSCGHGTGASVSGVGGVENSPQEAAAEPPQSQLQSRQQRCLHSTGNAPFSANLNRGENEASKLAKMTSDEDDEDEDDDDDEEDESGVGSESHETDERSLRKRKGTCHSPLIQQLDAELVNMLQDRRKSSFEKLDCVSEALKKDQYFKNKSSNDHGRWKSFSRPISPKTWLLQVAQAANVLNGSPHPPTRAQFARP